MAQLLIQLYIALALHGGESMTGVAPRYAPGVMERVIRVRHLAPAGCNVSSAYYGIGTELWVWSHNTKVVRRCRVADVSNPTKKNGGESDQERHQRTGKIIEFSYRDARWGCGLAHLNDRPERCPVTVIRIEGE